MRGRADRQGGDRHRPAGKVVPRRTGWRA